MHLFKQSIWSYFICSKNEVEAHKQFSSGVTIDKSTYYTVQPNGCRTNWSLENIEKKGIWTRWNYFSNRLQEQTQVQDEFFANKMVHQKVMDIINIYSAWTDWIQCEEACVVDKKNKWAATNRRTAKSSVLTHDWLLDRPISIRLFLLIFSSDTITSLLGVIEGITKLCELYKDRARDLALLWKLLLLLV